jgi:ABC-type lipoprotein export system ATPase subunit
MIDLQKVTKIYKLNQELNVHAVIEVDLQVAPGEFVVITGRSGSGKTTLLNLIAGLTQPTTGKVLLDGLDLWALSDKQRSVLRNQKTGFIFQFPSLLPTLNVLENVILPDMFCPEQHKEQLFTDAEQLLKTVGLVEKLNAYPRQLSAGQQQRVVVARALLNKPQFILADEPTSNLDEQTEQEIMELFQQIHRETGVTMLMVTHTRQLVRYGTRAVEMAGGSIVSRNGKSGT